ncbi:tRNA ligase-like protein [Dothidotthia symphoricarpi CBS 119687]|uniref:tRNA ligase n=1 Tax=Dothidotthia symphoricarpi CBS 119687 TaxID=1392245 RepID=A0A6A6AK87_9PLEO|nr:tRNA ligase-like protein [Dothidotthia symphoricarpi CBS 119687]KAF2131287.1 tRNA ligase-like protein [Dothidotthia symphoricarpi CBS 119687]
MAHRSTAPYAAQDRKEILALVQALDGHTGKKGKGGFSVRKHTFTLPTGRTVDSWKMQDWDYKKANLPTYARGLFTYKTMDGQVEIAVRGYDKFFNHGEVGKTEWKNVERDTRGPYELSVKENGCIIFISGLDDDTLLVCSKHSTGARGDAELSHACAGERWVERHIATVGKRKEDLARTLRAMNATLVAELCDDDFEEHVLAYTPDQAGLYVHGLNLNLPEFATYPGHLVDKFADEWGMKKVVYVMENDIQNVKTFLDKVAETGNYDGRDTEGFVIRCQARETEGAPYVDWFFKYKFEEPYLMYRQWRECTRALIAGKPPRYKKHKAITEEYLEYARRQFSQNRGLAKDYNANHGIIKMRDDFLAARGTTGAEIIRQELQNGATESKNVARDIVLVPIATIGCGKTTLALALVKLFGWGHFQNDNVTAKKGRGQVFADTISAMLVTNPVVIADRNNHQKRERDQIITDISRTAPDARFVALHYVHERSNYDAIRTATRKRVLDRGDNHQTIQAGSKGSGEIIQIMEGFMHRFQPADPSEAPDELFDLIINIDPTVDSRENLEVIINKMFETYPGLFEGKEMPTHADMDAAIQWAMDDYRPDFKMDLSRNGGNGKQSMANTQNWRQQSQPAAKSKKAPRMEYFSVSLDQSRITSILDDLFNDKDANTARLYNHMKEARRIQPEFHVTLIHRASAPQNQAYWDKLIQLNESTQNAQANTGAWEPELGKCGVHMERLIWDDRIMCFVVRLDGNAAEDLVFETTNPIAHVTVGTANSNIKPKESNDLLQRWLAQGSGGETGIGELSVNGSVVLDGSVRGVLGRL